MQRIYERACDAATPHASSGYAPHLHQEEAVDEVNENGCAQAEVTEMKRTRLMLCLLLFSSIATIVVAATATAQTVVVGTGNPDLDVPAVQAAVDQGGEVLLKGQFSFDRPPTVPTAPELAVQTGGLATVL